MYSQMSSKKLEKIFTHKMKMIEDMTLAGRTGQDVFEALEKYDLQMWDHHMKKLENAERRRELHSIRLLAIRKMSRKQRRALHNADIDFKTLQRLKYETEIGKPTRSGRRIIHEERENNATHYKKTLKGLFIRFIQL